MADKDIFFKYLGFIVIISFLIFVFCGCLRKTSEETSEEFDTKQLKETIEKNGGVITYAQDGIVIYSWEQEKENTFCANILIPPDEISKEAESILTAGEPVSEYSIQLSDGMTYSHQNQGTFVEGTDAWVHTYGSLQDIAEILSLDMLTSNLVNYPVSDNNLLLAYSKNSDFQRISIQSAMPKLEKGYSITDMNIYMCFGSDESSASFVFNHLTKEAEHEIYKIQGGEEAHILYDLSVKQGIIIVRMDGAYYMWELQGIKKVEDLYEFADSLCII